ncbi:hypothetical protein T11_13410 [Trichinella zimbabwensis]|uniref:Uncharacterized protein n=1 Tax=Trichinella zimbabwensis TaxID=268475 RepID=A0A0V1HR66_9BILA|nr:hypothetical protein T11_13410 [Trichinella zimbabwensis]
MNNANLLTVNIYYAQQQVIDRFLQNYTLFLDPSIGISIDVSLTYYWSCVENCRSSHVNSSSIVMKLGNLEKRSFISTHIKEGKEANKFATIKLTVVAG